MLPHEALEVRALGLADDLAGAVGRELVDHHPVVLKHSPEQPGRVLDQLGRRRDIRQPADQRPGKFQWRARPGRDALLELDDGIALEGMDRDVELAVQRGKAVTGHQAGPGGHSGAGERIAHFMHDRPAEDLLEPAADELELPKAEEGADIAGMSPDGDRFGIAYDHAAMRLDAAGDMDRFAIAVRQINGRHAGANSSEVNAWMACRKTALPA
jgi:hypothetical protein